MKKVVQGLIRIVIGTSCFISGCMVDMMKQESDNIKKYDQEIRKILEIEPKDSYVVSDLGDMVYVLVSGDKGHKEIVYHDFDKDGIYKRTTTSISGKLKPLGIIPDPNTLREYEKRLREFKKKIKRQKRIKKGQLLVYVN